MPLSTDKKNTEIQMGQIPTADTIIKEYQASRDNLILEAGMIKDAALKLQDYAKIDEALTKLTELNKQYYQLVPKLIEKLKPFKPLPAIQAEIFRDCILSSNTGNFFDDFVNPLHARYQEVLTNLIEKRKQTSIHGLLKWLSSPAPPRETSTIASTQKTATLTTPQTEVNQQNLANRAR